MCVGTPCNKPVSLFCSVLLLKAQSCRNGLTRIALESQWTRNLTEIMVVKPNQEGTLTRTALLMGGACSRERGLVEALLLAPVPFTQSGNVFHTTEDMPLEVVGQVQVRVQAQLLLLYPPSAYWPQ